MKMKACIFDLDGTLADSVESIAYNANKALADHGYPPNPVENYKQYAGDGARVMISRSLSDARDRELKDLETVYAAYMTYFQVDYLYHVSPYQDIPALLKALKECGVKLGVLSNKPHSGCVGVVEQLFGKNCFDVILGMTDEATKKPNPVGALQLARRLGAAPENCLYVGDTNTDIKTGLAAGMYTVGVTWGFRGEEELRACGAHAVINAPLELLRHLEKF